MSTPESTLVRLADRLDLVDAAGDLNDRVWPAFVDATDSSQRFWDALYDELADCQSLLLDADGETLLAAAHTIPVYWDGTHEGLPVGWDDALAQGVLRHRAGAAVNTLCALAVTIDPAHRGRRISPVMLGEMKRIAAERGFRAVIAPVRPTLKADYPLQDMDEYLAWRRADGRVFDPWVRTHAGIGAELVGVARRSMVVEAPIADWERWTGMRFPTSGEFVIPKALAPVSVCTTAGVGRYEEPNVWMVHPVDAPAAG